MGNVIAKHKREGHSAGMLWQSVSYERQPPIICKHQPKHQTDCDAPTHNPAHWLAMTGIKGDGLPRNAYPQRLSFLFLAMTGVWLTDCFAALAMTGVMCQFVDKFKTQYYLEAKEKNSISFKSQIIASLIRSHFIISLHNKKLHTE